MKLKVFIFALCLMLLTGCTTEGLKSYEEHGNLVQISNELYYHKTTGIVYIVFNEAAGYAGYGYMSPYYSANGNLCKYDMNSYSIVEIED